MKALNDIILLEVDEKPVETPEGIIIPEQAQKNYVGPIAKVLDVGPKADIDIKKGDWVVCSPQYMTNSVIKGVMIRYCRPVGIVAVLSQEEIDADIVTIEKQQQPIIVPVSGINRAEIRRNAKARKRTVN